jgi:hypothetical protein
MRIKKTKLLVAELKVIAFSLKNKQCRSILLEAAERLADTDRIARFYHNMNEKAIKRIKR